MEQVPASLITRHTRGFRSELALETVVASCLKKDASMLTLKGSLHCTLNLDTKDRGHATPKLILSL